MDKNDCIFVAGGVGLVGSSIVDDLISKGYLNIISSYHHNEPKRKERVRYIKVDLLNQEDTKIFFKKERPEYVFLAAAKVGGIIANNTYRAEFIYENLQIQNNVIHQSYINGVKKLLFLGSSCIYPRNSNQPIKEEYLLTDYLEYTNEPYAIAKIAGIKMCESYNLQYSTNYLSVMPTNLYGLNDNFDLEKSHVLPALIRKFHLAKLLQDKDFVTICKNLEVDNIKQALDLLKENGVSEDKVTLWGDGTPEREFLHSKDLADACVFLMENIDFKDLIKNNKEVRNTHINVGTGIDITIKKLANIVKDIVGFNGEIVWDKSKPNGTMKKLLNVSNLTNLGWKFKVEFTDGVKEVYEYYINNS